MDSHDRELTSVSDTQAGATELLRMDGLAAYYGELNAFSSVGLSVGTGQMAFVVGPNGAGKSTLLKCISGLHVPRSGSISFRGRSVLGKTPESLCRAGLALVPEGRHIFATLTVEENLMLAGTIRGDRIQLAEDVELVLSMFPILKARLKGGAGFLSGGEQQQLAIARAILLRPALMMIDEPSLGLAPLVIDKVYEALKALNDSGMTLLVVEQSAARVLEFADQITVMRSGRVVLNAKPSDIGSIGVLEEAYFGYAAAIQ